jgi:hypothetical protein
MNFVYLEGNVGSIKKVSNNTYIINIAENLYETNYKTGKSEKVDVIWYNCVCFFEPSVKVGDKVIARGSFRPSKNKNYPYSIIIHRIAMENKDYTEGDVVNGRDNFGMGVD